MSNLIAEYYFHEIDGWKDSIEYYYRQIDQAVDWLKGIVSMDTVPDLGASVEKFILKFEEARKELAGFEAECVTVATELTGDEEGEFLDDRLLPEAVIVRHRNLRGRMKHLEKEYLELKYTADEFVGDTLVVQRHS